MRLEAAWLRRPATSAVMGALEGAGHQALFVGGCVRNAILGLPVTDIDIATDARPDRVIELVEAAGLKAVPTGIDHGTVTVVSDAVPHEVTTFRRDVATDGRRATVAFTTRIAEDAARRDFSMNALYARADGTVLDPLGGLPDARARRVRFIGDPAARIREDGLRILRFFRFYAVYGDPEAGLDPEGLAAVAAMAGGLDPVSRERIGHEMARLLGAADPAPAMAAMADAAVLEHVLPDADPAPLAALVRLEAKAGVPPRWLRRLAAVGDTDWRGALRLSRRDAAMLAAIRSGVAEDLPPHAAAERFDAEIAEDIVLLRAAAGGGDLPPDWRADIALGASAAFPVTSADLIARHGQGPALGAALDRLRARWVDSRFSLDRAALLRLDAEP